MSRVEIIDDHDISTAIENAGHYAGLICQLEKSIEVESDDSERDSLVNSLELATKALNHYLHEIGLIVMISVADTEQNIEHTRPDT